MGYFSTPSPYTGSSGYSGQQYGFVPTTQPATDKPYDLGQFIQRPDLNQVFGQGANLLAAAGTAPGYIAERPLAWLNTATTSPGQSKGVVDQGLDFIKGIPLLGPALGMVGDALSTPWAAKVMNAQTANLLQSTYGLPDNTPTGYNSAGADPLAGIPVIGALFGAADVLNGGSLNMTVGQLRQQAMQRGFTQQDIQDLGAGKKGVFDFGNVAIHENPLFNLGAQIALDPTNLAFGAGILGKAGLAARVGADALKGADVAAEAAKGADALATGTSAFARTSQGSGLLGKFFSLAGKPVPQSFDAWTFGRNLANDWANVPYKGFAETVAAAARGTSYATKAYKTAAVGMTAAELGITGLDSALGDNTPISPYLEGLADFARRAQADQPLSHNNLFSLISALRFPYHDTLAAVKNRIGVTRYAVTGSDIVPAVVRELAPEAKSFPAQLKSAASTFQTGEQGLYQNIEWAVRSLAAEKVQRYTELIKPDSMVASDAYNLRADQEITRLTQEGLAKGEWSGQQVVERMKEMATNARQVGDFGSGVRFPWMPKMVGKVFSQWQSRVSQLAQMFDNRAPVVLKMLQDLPLPREHIQILRGSLDALAESNGGVVPRLRMAEILHDYPQLLRDEPFKTALSKYIIPDGPGEIAIGEIDKLLKAAEEKARLLNEYLYEFSNVNGWESRWHARMPKVRTFDPVTRRWAKDPSIPTGEVRVIAPSYLAGRARNPGLRAQTLNDVAALQGDATTKWFEDAAPKALDQSGFNVQAVTQTVGYDTARGELLPHIEVALTPEVKSWGDAGKIGAALVQGGGKKVAQQADYFIREMSGRIAGALGLQPNAWRLRWEFGRLTPEQADALAQLAKRTDGFFDQTHSAFELWDRMDAADSAEEVAQAIARAVPEDPAVGRLLPSRDAVYVEKVANDARGSVKGADEVLSNVKRAAATDPRYVAASTYLADSRGTAGLSPRPRSTVLRQSWEPSAAGVGGASDSAGAAQRVSDSWANVEAAQAAGADVTPHVDQFLATLHDAVAPTAIPDALKGLKTAVEARLSGNPIPAPLDDALMRAHEDFVSTGGNMGQVLFNAKLDAAGDSILPVFDKSLADAPLELKQKLADFQRQLVVEDPAYTVSLPPTGEVPLIYSNEVGKVFSDFSQPRAAWLRDIWDTGPLSKLSAFQRMLFSPRKAMAAADATKQSFYNNFLQYGATVTEINGFVNATRAAADLFELRGVKVVRSIDALPASVYEKIARGETAIAHKGPFRVEIDPAKIKFGGFAPEVVDRINAEVGGVWKLVDASASQWFRNVQNAARAPGTRGEIGRLLLGQYPKAMGIRHTAKFFYHIFRFLSDPRWWLMNEAEQDIMLGAKYGVNVRNASAHQPSTLAMFHQPGAQNRALQALEAASSDWYDNSRTQAAIIKTFDQTRPRSVQEALDALPETDPIIKLMVEKHGWQTSGTWGHQLIDDITSMDARGPAATITDEAKKIWSADEYAKMEQAGVLQRVFDINEHDMKDITSTLRGNPNRNLVERTLNSYWLYWPISYQLKAGKWIYDLLTNKMFGRKTNLGGAYLLSNLVATHERLLKDDPGYVDMFQKNPETWFFASMFLPITPFDLSVSLGRTAKVAGGVAGLWEAPNYSQNPFLFASKLAAMGPVFTAETLKRIGGELDPYDTLLRPFRGQQQPGS